MTDVVLDTSVSVPYLHASHAAHALVRGRLRARTRWLTTHSLAETYSVLTRLPGDARLSADDAVALIDSAVQQIAPVPAEIAASCHERLAARGIIGGAVYDALVGMAAREAGLPLATRDARAKTTYEALGVSAELIV